MAKKPKPRLVGGIEPEGIDILQMELDRDAPYWLSPVVKHANSPQARKARQQRYDEQWAKRKKAKR